MGAGKKSADTQKITISVSDIIQEARLGRRRRQCVQQQDLR